MDYIQLGATDLRVSRLGVGTAAFGLDRYGITAPGEGSVDPAAGIANIHRAVEGGVNFFDTAPAYGRSEELLGEALADHKDCLVATKVPIPENLDKDFPVGIDKARERVARKNPAEATKGSTRCRSDSQCNRSRPRARRLSFLPGTCSGGG